MRHLSQIDWGNTTYDTWVEELYLATPGGGLWEAELTW